MCCVAQCIQGRCVLNPNDDSGDNMYIFETESNLHLVRLDRQRDGNFDINGPLEVQRGSWNARPFKYRWIMYICMYMLYMMYMMYMMHMLYVCVCVCVCVCVWVYVYMLVCARICKKEYVYVYLYFYSKIYAHVCMYVCVYMFIGYWFSLLTALVYYVHT